MAVEPGASTWARGDCSTAVMTMRPHLTNAPPGTPSSLGAQLLRKRTHPSAPRRIVGPGTLYLRPMPGRARACVSPVPVCPREVADLLESHPVGTGLKLVEGIPEHVTPLPEPGEGRNHDLLLLGHGGSGNIVISVEAKVDESFGETIGTYCNSASHSDKPTRAPQRIKTLLAMAFGAEARPDADPWRGLRYQLLTAVTGTAIEAASQKVSTAVVVVHEFRTESIDAEKAQTNASDFATFVGVLLGLPPNTVVPGRLYGPVVLAQGKHLERPVDLFIGKAVFDWRRETQEFSERPIVHRRAA